MKLNKKSIIAAALLVISAAACRCSDGLQAQPKQAVPSADENQLQPFTLKNQSLAFTACLAGPHLVHRALASKLVGLPYYMEGEDFVLDFQGQKINSSDLKVTRTEREPNRIRFDMSAEDFPLEARLEFQIPEAGNFIEKTVYLRATRGRKFLQTIRLIDLRKGGEPPETFPGPGQPVYKKNRFFAIAYPLSRADISGGETRLWYEVGKNIGPDWWQSCPAVMGVAEDGKVKQYFFQYLDQKRHRKAQPFLLYNSWYDMPGTVNSEGMVNAVKSIKQSLTDPYGIKLDAVVMDDGWDLHSKLWQFDPRKFPQGLGPVQTGAAEIGAKPGIWFSPVGGYSTRKNDRILNTLGQGYEKNIFTNIITAGFCPAGGKYHRDFQNRITDAARDGVVYFKLDNIGGKCVIPWHGHARAPYSQAAVTDALIEIMNETHKTNPEVFFNLTVGTWLSPFWLLYADAVWMGGMDYGFAGPGSEREKNITYRDQNLFRQFREKNYQFPLNAVMTHGTIKAKHQFKAQEPVEEFEHDVVMYFGRGVSMWELYISPEILTQEEWAVLAKWIQWAKDNWAILQNSEPVLGDPSQLQIYGYLHQAGNQALLIIRNPLSQSQTISLSSLPQLKKYSSAIQQFPQIRNFSISELETFNLQPFQVVVLKF